MSKKIKKVGAGMAIAVLSLAGFATVAPGTAHANDACEDFIKMLIAYDENGYRATADALWDNLVRDGCV